MAITNDDVKLFESQRLTDEEDGGGRVTGSEIINGNVNNLFHSTLKFLMHKCLIFR
ncbi:hypothetical protein [Endozoicomonas sp. GU-1]|uniref:hypothetical protein n=1 Tax=Endozoicomonas sp. GU-1 TaxID=3009078 RepID=UPI0022B5C465|nr:hypothetical protein [Endozoicomonas sp. GU-1]WBA83741.1 hypothetical protein O2T12_11795 [Endozoicomonas sp. GU-1]WBA86722.1 hypothetical protein O3276_01365 [Endozoicomonas sp. GU-1]